MEVVFLIDVPHQRTFRIIPRAEVVELAPYLLRPTACGVWKEGEIGIGFSGLGRLAPASFTGRITDGVSLPSGRMSGPPIHPYRRQDSEAGVTTGVKHILSGKQERSINPIHIELGGVAQLV